MTNRKSFPQVISLLMLITLGGCAVTPKHLDSHGQDEDSLFLRKVVNPESEFVSQNGLTTKFLKGSHSLTPVDANAMDRIFLPVFSNGDTLKLSIQEMDQFDGLYKIDSHGKIDLPFADSLIATGLTRNELINALESELVNRKWFYQGHVSVDISAVQFGPALIAVTGAVFHPGQISINNRPADKPEDAIQQQAGAYSNGRDLVAALASAGGLRPDADLAHIYLKRDSYMVRLNLHALLDGNGFTKTPHLVNGDEIVVLSTGHENPKLIKPSQITPPGLRVFMSNLIAPALSNAQGAIGSDSTRLPYGSSLLDSAVSANCVGGTHYANASRSILLITRNHGSKQQIVIKRSINQLLANSSDYAINPYLMPNDAVACYDSKFTNFRDVARGIGEVISPVLLGGLL